MTQDLEVCIRTKDHIIPMYEDILDKVLDHQYVHYVFPGGRGSTKSSFISICIPLLIIDNPNIHAAVFRKVGNTIKTSVWGQVVWAIYQLGLESFFTIPKTHSNPIIYNPTGQRIMFFGLDDADKVKSIKLPFGYIGVTWFEELDQYAGETELRKVTQSTMRGGDKFWDFRSFNPPISMNNWANEYALECEQREDTVVVRNTYLDVPEEWLGQQFIEEAEMLKQLNPDAYTHEYMGVAIGTGGNVFYNVEDIDTDKLIDINGTKVPMWATFSNIYCGIDWGFAVDPFRFVKMHYDTARRVLYIYDEYSTTHTRNEDVFNTLFKELKKVDYNQLITADSAEQKSTADFKAFGAFIRNAEKGPDSVRYGIKWLQGLTKIYIDKRKCPLTYKEFVTYEYDTDRDGNWISAYPDRDNHSIDAVRYALERFYKRRGN